MRRYSPDRHFPRNRHRRLPVAVLALSLLAGAAWALTGNPFEATDGNLLSDGGTDWESFVGSPDLTVGVDLPPGQTDNSFSDKEDHPAPEIVEGSIPQNKSDLLRFYVAHEGVDVAGAKKDYLYLAWIRANTLGSANMDFEFNQSGVLSANGTTPERTEGDLLVTFGFTGNDGVVNLGLSRWTETGPCEAASSAPCWGPIIPLGGFAEGAVNSVAVTDPIESVSLDAQTFGEAVINLTDAGVFDRDQCVTFGSAYVKSRSSTSFTSQLKDFIEPIDVAVSNCSTITIVKDAVPDDDQDFTFHASTELSVDPFYLDDDGDDSNALSSRQVFESRVDGPFTVTEDPLEGWDLTDVSCTVGGTPEVDGDGSPTGQVVLDVVTGDTVQCTFVNTRRGRIVVHQVTNPGSEPQIFSFILSGGPESVNLGFGLTDADAPYDSGSIRPGTYVVSQTDPGPEWDLVSATCDDGSPAGAVDVAPGETVNCTFINTKRGRIAVDVITDPSGDPASFGFSLDGGPEGVDQTFALSDADAPHDSDWQQPGTYAVNADAPGEAWDLTGATCDDGSDPGSVALGAGEIVLCTFTYVRRGRILVDQVTDPSGDPQTFQFSVAGGPESLDQAFGLTDGDDAWDSGVQKPGTYAVSQTDPGVEWDLVGATCSDGSPVGAVDLAPGETVTCTFTNVKRGHILVDTVTDPSGDPQVFQYDLGGGPEAVAAAFGQTDADAPYDSGAVKNGTYAVSQADPGAEWDLVSATCSDGSPVGAVDLAPGETVTCTFTNVKRGHILVQKTTDPAGSADSFSFGLSGGPEGVDDAFALTDGAPAHDSGALKPGTYAVSEADPGSEWDLTATVCSDGSPVSAVDLAPGETVTCTFTNTQRGHLVIDQVTDPSGDPQVFQFVLSGGPEGVDDAFGLRDTDTPHDSSAVKPGTYSVTQTDPGAEWDLDSAVCDDGSLVSAVVVAPGETVTCTFTNVKRGHILIDKVTVPGGSPKYFEFTVTGGPESVDQTFSLRDRAPLADSGPVRAGIYAVAEAATDETWDLTGAICDDGSPVGAVDVSPGETVTCTFTNTKRAFLTVELDAVPDDPQDFGYMLSGPEGMSAFILDDDNNGTFNHRLKMTLPHGDYTVVQGDAGLAWDLVGISCSDARADSTASVDLSASSATVGLVPAADVTCVFTNQKRGRIIVEKYVVDEGTGVGFDPRDFPFQFSTGYGDNFYLKHGETNVSAWLPTGRSYSISELVPRGFEATSECVYPDDSTETGGGSISVDLEPAAEVVCTFTNEMYMHPGSKGFWRNWRNHYDDDEMRMILAEAFALSPIYSSMFDGSGQLVPDAIAVFDSILDTGGITDAQSLLTEQTTTFVNLAVSKSEDPAIRALQNNDDLCFDCLVDVTDAGTLTLLSSWAPCTDSGEVTVSDLIAVVEQTWTGDVRSGDWRYDPLSSSHMAVMTALFGGVNGGSLLTVDPTNYPDSIQCLEADTPHVTTLWYRDADGDGWGANDSLTPLCTADQPDGWVPGAGDCDDSHDTVNPDMSEQCDGLDNDCDGTVDSGLDSDGDLVDDMCDAFPSDADRSGPMHLGTAEIDDVWSLVDLPGEYQDPIIIVGAPTENDGDPGVVRLRNVGAKSFEIRFREWLYLDTVHDAKESVSFLVMERGRYTMGDGSIWEVDSYPVHGTGAMMPRSFTAPFPSAPALILTVQSETGGTPVTVRARSLDAGGFSAALYEEESLMDGHLAEQVGYLAVHSGRKSGTVTVGGTALPYALQTVEIDHRYSPVLAWNLRLQEEQSKDAETDHADETVSVLAVGSHLFAQDVRSKGTNVVTPRRLDPDVGDGMEWGMLSGVDRTWLTVPLAKSYVDPVVIVKPLSNDGSVPGVIRLRNVDADSFDVRLREWKYLTGAPGAERVFYLVCEAGQHEIAGLLVEAGKVDTDATIAAGTWEPVAFAAPFGTAPAVFTSVQTRAGWDPVVTRITGRDATGFSVAMAEEEGLDGLHWVETIGWIAIEPGTGITSGGRAVEVFDSLAGSDVSPVSFTQVYGRRFPSVVADVVSSHETDTCSIRHDNVSATGVDLFVEEEQSMDDEMIHAMEDISVFVAE